MERLITLKRELQANFEDLKQEHEDLKNANEEYQMENKRLLTTIGERDIELESARTIKADHDTLLHKYQNLERIHGLLRENAEKFQEENQELHEEVFKLQEQVTKLEHDLEVVQKHADHLDMVPRDTYEQLLREVNELKERRNSNQIHLDEINIDDNAKGVIETLKRDISELKHKLAQKEISCPDNVDNKVIKSEKIMHLYNKYVNFELPIDYVGEIPSAGDNIVLFKLESVFKTVNSFKKEIDILDHQLSEKNLNADHLQTQIDDLTTENDFLTTDIQHLERELNEMKKNNDFLISEIAALKNTSKLQPIIETHEDNLAKLETELADSNNMNKLFESEIKRILKELDEVRAEKTSLHDALRDLKQKYTTMLDEFEMLKNQTKTVTELEQNVNNQDSEKLKKTVDEIDDLKKRLNAANSKNEQLSIDIHILENDKVLLTKKVDDLQNVLDEKSHAHKELETLKSTLDCKLHDFENKLDEVIRHKQEVEVDRQKLQEKVIGLQDQLTTASTESNAKLENLMTEKTLLGEQLKKASKENETLSASIEKLKTVIADLRRQEQELVDENQDLKKNIQFEKNSKVLEETIDELKSKTVHQDILTNEVASLKDENKKLIEKKIQLEAELVSTDSKIVHLEEEFDKLIVDLNEKDTLIDGLNNTIHHNNITLQKLNETAAEMEKSISIKNDEIHKLARSVEELTSKLNETIGKSDRSQEELDRLHGEKEELSKQVYSLNDEINSKNTEISSLSLRLEQAETFSNDLKTVISNKEKEIKELNQSIVELTDKIKTKENVTSYNDDYAKLVQEKKTVEAEVVELKEAVAAKEKMIEEIKESLASTEKLSNEYKSIIDTAMTEKTELINLINLKHNESIQYHNEIQRLNHVILEQTNEYKKVIEEKDKQLQNTTDHCKNCENLMITLKEKDGIIISLSQNASGFEKAMSDLVAASESVKTLSEKCENLEKSLSVQMEIVKKLTAENIQLSEQEQNLVKELERLRRHLVETEENYTQELMSSEQKLTECQARLHQVEERAKQTSTVYTSNSIRANQEVETYRNQIKLLEKQRDEVQARLSEAEDARSRSEAALTNLQVVLEQFQLDKERDIHTATEKIRNKMEEQKRENQGLQIEISRLNAKLEEALAGLQAASRLGDQVEMKRAEINDLKEQGPPPNLPKTGHSRNPSTGSNNLLFHNLDTMDTASQFSRDSDREPRVITQSLDTGVNQTRNTEGAILKSVLKDM
ncbi:hypothetical protein HF086_010828 [Spodoptera exigua]|uniref:Uncharacterized protein n=1 Tax=Spodoptera exigua TaxID=7107 RepID=A0A922SCC6_SPOEX|nr:hypothetical protein HF086_010828 [Spodoptera exigua]